MSCKFGTLITKFVVCLVLWFGVFNQIKCQSSLPPSPEAYQPKNGQKRLVITDKSSHYGKHFILGFIEQYYKTGFIRISIFATRETDVNIITMWPTRQNISLQLQAGQVKHIKFPDALRMHGSKIERKGIEVQASENIAIICLNHAESTSDAFLALPTAVLSTVYVVASYKHEHGEANFGVISWNNNTNIRISVNAVDELNFRGITYRRGGFLNVTLDKLESFHILHKHDLSGTIITADKPVVVISGHTCATIGFGACDHLSAFLLPVKQWGRTFIVSAPDIFRVFAYENVTVVHALGRTSLSSGNFTEIKLGSDVVGSFIECNKPCQVVQYMNSGENKVHSITSDPSMTIIPSVNQYLSAYHVVRFKQSIYRLSINLIIKRSFKNSLEIDGIPLTGLQWKIINGTEYVSATYANISCCQDILSIYSSAKVPFGLIVHGEGDSRSIAYPGGFSLSALFPNATAITKHDCPANWIPLISSCYYFSKVKTSWTNANSSCRTLGGHLAVPKNSVENNAIWKAAVKKRGHEDPWIGLVRHGDQTFYTVHGSKPEFTPWGPGQPDNAGRSENCVHYFYDDKDKWNDISCSRKYNFICERPKLSQLSSITPTASLTAATAAMKFTTTIRPEGTTNVPGTFASCDSPSSSITPTASLTVTRSTATMKSTVTTRQEKTTDIPRTTEGVSSSCLSDRESTIWGIFIWPETRVGSVAKVVCPQNSEIFAFRLCQRPPKSKVKISWGLTNASSCPELKETSRKIFDLSKKTLNSTNVIRVTEEVSNLTSAVKKLIPDDIGNVASALEKIVQVKGMANEVADGVFSAVDNILDASFDVVAESQKDSDSSGRILQLLDSLLENINISEDGFNRTLKNFAVDISTVSVSSFPGLTFTAKFQENMSAPLQAEDIVKKSSDQVTTSSSKATSIVLPKTLFNDTVDLNSSQSQAVIFSLYKDTKFFQVNPSVLANNSLNSYVIAGSIRNQSIKNLKSSVVLSFSSLKRGNENSALCVYWNFSVGGWSREGCTLQRVEEDGTVICHCNHLTNFAMLLDINTDGGTVHTEILGIISYIGCAVSLVGLVLTIITILLFKDLRTKTPSKLLLNFCIALSLTLIVFLSAAERSKVSSMTRCRAAAVALHYFVLATFMWMAVEAFNMYLMFIKVIPQYIRHFTAKCCIVAWGTPAVIVLITLGTALDKYGDSKYCRLYGIPFIVSFLAPIVLILIGNTIAFVLIFRALVTSGSKVTAQREVSSLKQARQGFAIMVLLGLTWLFGILAVKDAKLVFQYLFCIFNSLQGLFIFIFYCLLSPGTRKKYKFTLRRDPTTAYGKGSRTHDNQYRIDTKSEKTGMIILKSSRTLSREFQNFEDCPPNNIIELKEY